MSDTCCTRLIRYIKMTSKGARHAVSHDAHSASCSKRFSYNDKEADYKYLSDRRIWSKMSNDIRFQKRIGKSSIFEFFEPDICDK